MSEAEFFGYGLLILKGCWVTIELTVLGCALALALAFVVGMAKISRWWWLRAFANIYIEFFRGTSIFVQLFWAFFVLPIFGLPLPAMTVGVLVLGMNVSAYSAEVVRGAILAVPREQYEACTALNLTRWQSFRHVVLPQAVVIMLPPLNNNAIELLKGSAVVSLITITDMTFQAQVIRSTVGDAAFPFLMILVLYFAISWLITVGIRALEHRLSEGLDVTRA